MPNEDSAMQDALDEYNQRLANSRDRARLFIGLAMCAGAALSWGLSVLAAFTVFKDPAVAADFDSGTHTNGAAWEGCAAVIFALVGLALLIAGIWRSPSRMRWVGLVILLLGGVPLAFITFFAFALSR